MTNHVYDVDALAVIVAAAKETTQGEIEAMADKGDAIEPKFRKAGAPRAGDTVWLA